MFFATLKNGPKFGNSSDDPFTWGRYANPTIPREISSAGTATIGGVVGVGASPGGTKGSLWMMVLPQKAIAAPKHNNATPRRIDNPFLIRSPFRSATRLTKFSNRLRDC